MEPICGFRLQGDPRPCPSLLKVVFQVIPASPGMAKLKRFEEQRAATTAAVQSSQRSRRYPIVRRRRRPLPGDVFYDLQDRNQLLVWESILIP
jgi:hypothetical protein